MYKIDFTPPPSKDPDKKTDFDSTNYWSKLGKSLLKSKIVWGGFIFSIIIFSVGSYYIEENISDSVTQRIYSDVEFMGNKTLSETYYLEFESDTAKTIYNIEYQNHALSTLKYIVSLIENDIERLKTILPIELKDSSVELFDLGERQVLLLSTRGQSSIKKYPIVANFAIHFKDGKAQKIQSFFNTSDDFIIQDKLGVSTFANWHKKKILIIDTEVSIFEANLAEPVIKKTEPIIIEEQEVLTITSTPENKIVNAPEGEETEENDEQLTADDLEDHENLDEPELIEENKFFVNSHNH